MTTKPSNDMQRRDRRIPRATTALFLAAVAVLAANAQFSYPVSAQMAAPKGARFDADGATAIPEGFREWPFLGAPLTPDALNGGAAGFPEYHHVYLEPSAFEHYKRTGEFPEGATIVKELVLLKEAEYDDGSRDEPSGRGYFADRFAGIDMMVKDSERFAETGGWGFFNFGHHEPPYADEAAAAPNEECAFCHTANATYDMVFTTFYPILGRK
jgi:hypothetical protein